MQPPRAAACRVTRETDPHRKRKTSQRAGAAASGDRGWSRVASDSELQARPAPRAVSRGFPHRAPPHYPTAPAPEDAPVARLGSWQRLYLNRKHGWKIVNQRGPTVSAIAGRVNLSAGGAEIDAARIQRI